MSDYPRAIYRDGSQMNIWGHDVDYRTVRDEEEEAEALSNGWRLTPNKVSPLDHDGDGKPGGSRDAYDQMTDEELRAAAEKLGPVHHRAGRVKLLQILRDADNV